MPCENPRGSPGPEYPDLIVLAERAIQAVGEARKYFSVGPILRGPMGGPVDVAILYNGVPVDIMHYDPYRRAPSPKGRPVHYHGPVDEALVREDLRRVLGELTVLLGAEYREPEQAWVVPLAWRNLIVLHARVSWDGGSIKPDYGLQARLLREGLL